MADRGTQEALSSLAGPPVNPEFETALNDLVAVAKDGHSADSSFFNPSDEWLVSQAGAYGNLSPQEQAEIVAETREINVEAERANAEGKAALRAGPDVAVPLSSGGLAFFQSTGRRPASGPHNVFHRRFRQEPRRPGFRRGQPSPLRRCLPPHRTATERTLRLGRDRCPVRPADM